MTVNITGASVVLVEKYHNYRTNRTGLAFILFRDRRSKMYSEAGGSMRKNDSPAHCAQRELREESLGLFRIDIPKLVCNDQLFELNTYRDQHKAYVMYVKGPPRIGIRRNYYHSNLRLLDQYPSLVPAHWRETDDMTRVYAQDIAGALTPGKVGCMELKDAYGEKITIHHRTVSILKKLIGHSVFIDSFMYNPSIHQLRSGHDGACSHGLGDKSSDLRKATNHGVSKCLYY